MCNDTWNQLLERQVVILDRERFGNIVALPVITEYIG